MFALELAGDRREGLTTIDVLDERPDGATWLMGTITIASAEAARTVHVELAPFAVAGSHVLMVEQDGRRLGGTVTVAVVSGSSPKKKTAAARRYLGRGSTVY